MHAQPRKRKNLNMHYKNIYVNLIKINTNIPKAKIDQILADIWLGYLSQYITGLVYIE